MRLLAPCLLAAALALPGLTAGPALAGPPGGCPPGLAKKDPPCVPPGQAKKGLRATDDHAYRERDRDRRDDDDEVGRWYYDGHRYRRGDPLDGLDYTYLGPRALAQLPLLPDGHTYVRVGNQIVEVDEQELLFVRTVGLLNDLLN